MGSVEPAEYCRQIEIYLCQKNDGHLIRVVGPSFEIVSRWAADGIPLKVAFRGIDRYFERYYRSGPRRRPVRIDFCEAEVLDVFDEWRRAIGLTRTGSTTSTISEPEAAGRPDDEAAGLGDGQPSGTGGARREASLPAHLRRAVLRLTDARTSGALGPEADLLIDALAQELDRACAAAKGLRGDARRALIERLSQLDGELVQIAQQSLALSDRLACEKEADEELGTFRDRLSPDAYDRARAAAVDRLVRERFGLPTLSYV